jgi:hypothetical protein
MRPHIFEFTLLSSKVVKFCDWNIHTKEQAIRTLYSMFKFKPTIIDYYYN